ncbi:dTDP-glucose 4,6-dehydratase [Calditrichota bacterium]
MSEKLFITGGAGFIGSNLVKLILRKRPDWQIINYDGLTYAGNLESLSDIEGNPNYSFIKGDITDLTAVRSAMSDCTGVLHLAAESHVDRSILDPGPFLKTNVIGTQVVLETARMHNVKRFVQVSTDEVYGSLMQNDPPFTESHGIDPSSPYSSSKAGADLLALAYFKTFDLPVIVTRCSNNYGPYQFPEKLLPLVIRNAMQDIPIPVYGDGQQVRDWIYVEDHCEALLKVYEQGKIGQVYNIGGNSEIANLELVKSVLSFLGKNEEMITFVKDRAGHDRRYAIDNSKIKSDLDWEPASHFKIALRDTVDWYQKETKWINSILTGEYQSYYESQYARR